MSGRLPGILLALALCWLSPVYAFSNAAESGADAKPHFPLPDIVQFSKRVERTLAARGARVFIIARQGRPERDLPAGIHYTHTGIAVYSQITAADGSVESGYVIHNLYQKPESPASSHLVEDYPAEFFTGAYALRAGIIIPTPLIQRRLQQLLAGHVDDKLHNPRYSALANPFNSQYQNCTELLLDMVNAAVYQTTDTAQLKAYAQAYFEPRRLQVSPVKLLLGAFFLPDVTLADHTDQVATSTFGSIAEYMQAYDLATDVLEIQ